MLENTRKDILWKICEDNSLLGVTDSSGFKLYPSKECMRTKSASFSKINKVM